MTCPRLAAAALVPLLAACVVPVPIPLGEVPTTEDDACGAGPLADRFVGQDAAVLFATFFTAPIRVVRPGDAATQDVQPRRINFDVDADGRITGVRCG